MAVYQYKGDTRGEELVIRPASEGVPFNLREYYQYRHMLKALVWRNFRTQFDQMYLGVAWACVRPLLYVLVFTVIRNLSNLNSRVEIPYLLYVYSGLILWYYFIESVQDTASSVKSDSHLLKKVYFPRLITPVVPIIANLVGLGVSLIPLVIMMFWYGIGPSWRLILLPIIVLQCMVMILGIGTMFAALTLVNRDWDRFLNSILYIGLFVSPIIYSPAMIPDRAQLIYTANPMVGTLLAFRSIVFEPQAFPLWEWAYSCVFSVVVLFFGVKMFRATETQFADKL